MSNIKVIVPVYNSEKWISKTIESIKKQTYKNFECVVIDDISTDATPSIIRNAIEDDGRFSAIINMEKKYALKNIYDGIKSISSDDEDIIITIDGDDWLSDEFVFEKINNVYEKKKCLITYGSFVEYPSGVSHALFLEPYPSSVLENNLFRNVAWRASHLRTFKKKLWDKIKLSDLIDPTTNDFYEVAWDLSFMYPMLEMAGTRSEHVKDRIYIYNKQNPLSDMYIKERQQLECAAEIKRKPKYLTIDFDEVEN
tara:strand:+ start:5922 stop:6683 length:762 start_codon:yes stop_codon:yes gene_type:complete